VESGEAPTAQRRRAAFQEGREEVSDIFPVLFAAHMLGDWVIQTDKQAMSKIRLRYALSAGRGRPARTPSGSLVKALPAEGGAFRLSLVGPCVA
jgi:hypothetical protein